MAGKCTRCRRDSEYGHRDSDNHLWYCEDCLVEFCGNRRACAYCREKIDVNAGRVDPTNQYFYCTPCLERPRAPPPGPGPVGYPGYPPPAYGYPGYPPPMYGYPGYPPAPAYGALGYAPPGGSGDSRRSRSRSPKKGRGRGDRGDKKGFNPKFNAYHSQRVPKSTDFQTEFAPDGEEPKTTAMLRNIPNKFTQAALLEEIDAEGFAKKYDFFYLVMDLKNQANVGYAFINLLDPADMKRFCEHFEGYQFKKYNSQKIATVSPAHVQGFDRNVQQLAKKAVTQYYKPIVIRDGEQKDFDEIAKELG